MANTIIIKQSSVASKIPGPSDLVLGELAVNTTDGKMFMKKGDNSIIEINAQSSGAGAGASNATLSPSTELMFTSSETWVAPFTGTVKITAIGGGGGGGYYVNSSSTGSYLVNGGGAGGCARTEVAITQGSSYVITIGTGGSPRTSKGSGGNGGTTSVTGTGVSLSAGGGTGGAGAFVNATLIPTRLGGAGGTASGGQYNYTGGDGGTIYETNNTSAKTFATGGGAVGLTQDGYSAGDIGRDASGAPNTSGAGVTGGAGVGGRSGSLTRNGSVSSLTSGGGSAYGSYPDNAGSTELFHTNVHSFNFGPEQSGSSVFDVTGPGGFGVTTSTNAILVRDPLTYSGGPGGGGGGAASKLTIGYVTEVTGYFGGNGGVFGGGGASMQILTNPTSTSYNRAGYGGIGGGGGGCVDRDTSSRPRSSGAGGVGLVVIQYTEIS